MSAPVLIFGIDRDLMNRLYEQAKSFFISRGYSIEKGEYMFEKYKDLSFKAVKNTPEKARMTFLVAVQDNNFGYINIEDVKEEVFILGKFNGFPVFSAGCTRHDGDAKYVEEPMEKTLSRMLDSDELKGAMEFEVDMPKKINANF